MILRIGGAKGAHAMDIAEISDTPAEQQVIFARGIEMKIGKFDKKNKIQNVEVVQKSNEAENKSNIRVVPLSTNDDSRPYNRFIYDEEDAAGIIIDMSSGTGPDIYLFDDED